MSGHVLFDHLHPVQTINRDERHICAVTSIIWKDSIRSHFTLRLCTGNRISNRYSNLSSYFQYAMPGTSFIALGCTHLPLTSLIRCWDQIGMQYSKQDLTRLLYNAIIVSLNLSTIFFLSITITPSTLLLCSTATVTLFVPL